VSNPFAERLAARLLPDRPVAHDERAAADRLYPRSRRRIDAAPVRAPASAAPPLNEARPQTVGSGGGRANDEQVFCDSENLSERTG